MEIVKDTSTVSGDSSESFLNDAPKSQDVVLSSRPEPISFGSHLSQKSSFNTPDFGFRHAQKPQACWANS